MKLIIVILLQCINLVLCKKEMISGHCDKDGCSESYSCERIMSKAKKKVTVDLVSIEDKEDVGNQAWMRQDVAKMFFVESSGRDHLSPRQACALESGVRTSGVQIIVVAMTSKTLYLGENNATCQIFTNFANPEKGPRIYFRHVNVDSFLNGTPLEGSHLTGHLNRNEDKIIGICNYSDVIRLILLNRYGGWYSDLDIVFVRDVTKLENVVAADNRFDTKTKNPEDYGAALSNAIFHCEANCSFIAKTIEMHSNMFSSRDWASGGSKLFTKAMKSICTIPEESQTKEYFNPKDHTRKNCQGMKVLSPDSFFPIPWFEASTLWSLRQSTEEWENQFKDSYTVHFYQSSWRQDEEIERPEFYEGSLYPSYVPLALKHCPLSFYSDDTF